MPRALKPRPLYPFTRHERVVIAAARKAAARPCPGKCIPCGQSVLLVRILDALRYEFTQAKKGFRGI